MTKRWFTLQPLERRVLLAGDVGSGDQRADLNLDGTVDAADVRLIVDQLASEQAAGANSNQASLDLNGDGEITAADALRVINQIGRSELSASSELVAAEAIGPGISILDAEVVEGNAGVTTIEFTVKLSEPAPGPVSVNVSVANDSAAALRVERIAAGLNSPVFVTTAPGDPGSLFVVEQTGQIKVLDLSNNTVRSTPFLAVTDLISGGERGLLGLAFHPDYASNRLFYIYMTDTTGGSLVREYQATADGSSADPLSARRVLGFSQPYANHNGGWMAFGPDDHYLYIATGDGGSANDPQSNAQDITNNWLGKMLRIDVDGDDFPTDPNRNYSIPPTNPFVGIGADDEIWAYGLRNPWRNSFDRETGDFYIADVGQNVWEEINVQPASSPGGENYGWRLREGLVPTPSVGGDKPNGAIDPIYVYRHGTGLDQGYSITGGYVYRGPIKELQGNYFFADYVMSRVWSLRFNGDQPADFDGTNSTDYTRWTTLLRPDVGQISSISSFGEDAEGNLYILDYGGEIFRLSGGGDYLESTTTIDFGSGDVEKIFTVEVLGDRLPEDNETFLVSLSNPTNGMIVQGQATGTILNDDPPLVESVVVNRGEGQRSIVDEVVVTFGSQVELDESSGNAFGFRNLDTLANVDYVKNVSNLNGKTVVTFLFVPGPSVLERGSAAPTLANGNYELQIVGSRVRLAGVSLDGNSDGLAGGDYQFVDQFFRKFGDDNANGTVDLLDFAEFRRAFGAVLGETTFNDGFDADGDGSVGLLDFAEFRRNFGT